MIMLDYYSLIIFDLDGVLIDLKDSHYHSLNEAIGTFFPKFVISKEDHYKFYDGLSTKDKLELLTKKTGLEKHFHYLIWERKQEKTLEWLYKIKINKKLQKIIKDMAENYDIVCCSNAVKNTIEISLKQLRIFNYFSGIYSNEDVMYIKPDPEIFISAMNDFGVLPEKVLIVEDSPKGLAAAYKTGAKVIRVDGSMDISYEKFMEKIEMGKNNRYSWVDEKMNILIPMAGDGSRFKDAGYTVPKPLIPLGDKTMIETVVHNLNISANYIFIVRDSHIKDYNIDSLLKRISPTCEIVPVKNLTEGAACTTLLAKKYIDNDNSLLIANSDQYVDWDSVEFMYKMKESKCDGGILTFNSKNPKWSYAEIDENGIVKRVAEKDPISNHATVGIYYWKRGADYVKYAEDMIEKNIRVNGEFYTCPVYNEAIYDKKSIIIYELEDGKMWGLGIPKDVEFFLRNKLNLTDYLGVPI